MKRQRKSWATRELPPLTLAELERHLDLIAGFMVKWPDMAKFLVPIYRRIERERDAFQGNEATIAAAHERIRRLSDRTAAQPS
ncbi:MAG: hypothetical protein ABTQ31_18925 [Rhizobiaceae bacterium]